MADGQIHGHTKQPGVEAAGPAKGLDRLKRLEERFLRHVARVLDVSAQPAAGVVDPVLVLQDKLRVRLNVPRLDLPNNGGVLERDRAGRRLHACPSAGLDVRPPRRVPDGWPVRRVGHRIPHVSPHLARGRRGGQRGFGTLGGVGGRADSGRALPGYGTCRSALRLRGPESGQLDGMRGRGRRPSQKLDHRFRSRLRTQRPSTPHPGGCSTTLQATI